MEVTRGNFLEVLTELDDILNNATFLAIDGEFTGLNSGPEANAFDTPAQYYAKLRTGSMNFLLVQFGLSVFTYNSSTEKYSQRTYNFYVFPKPYDRNSADCRFMCQASSIAFLANQGFDFNKLFKYGIPYLTKPEEEKLNKRMEEKQRVREEGLELIPISDDDKPHIDDICKQIEEFAESGHEELIIEKCNAFMRRLIFQEVRLRCPDKVRLESKNDNGNQYIVVYKTGTKEEEEQKEAERREKEKIEVQQAVGLSALLRKIADSGKLIVGHNMLLDLCHIIHQFFGPLPESYSEFKNLVHGLFPKLLDTKIICQSAQFKESVPSSILNHLLETLQSPPFSLPEIENVTNRSYTLKKENLHEAGYDAYITGICFISLYNRLRVLQTPEVSTVLADSSLLNPYLNKLLIARLKDYPYINLTGRDPTPSRDHVFHITFPKQWKLSDLSQLFSPYGGAYVSWLSDTTAYAALYRRDQVSAVVQNLFKSTQYSLLKYREHQANLENEKPVKQERKRKASESDSPSKESPPKSTGEVDGTTNSSNTSPSGQEQEKQQDGWEVASGNEHTKQTHQEHDNDNDDVDDDDDDDVDDDDVDGNNVDVDDDADDDDVDDNNADVDDDIDDNNKTRLLPNKNPTPSPSPSPPKRNYEEFRVVRKVRLRNRPRPLRKRSDLSITTSTRYYVLSDLDDDEDNEENDETDDLDAEVIEEVEEIVVKSNRVVELKKRSSLKNQRSPINKSTTDSPKLRRSPKKGYAVSSSPGNKRVNERQSIRRRTFNISNEESNKIQKSSSPLRRPPKKSMKTRWWSRWTGWLKVLLPIILILAIAYVMSIYEY